MITPTALSMRKAGNFITPLTLSLITVVVVGAITVSGFFSGDVLGVVLNRGVVAGIVSVGMAVALIAGQFDLSGVAVLSLSGITVIQLESHMPTLLAAVVSVLVGVLVGALNGLIVVYFQVQALIVTLGTFVAVRALAHVLTDSQPVSGKDPLAGLFMIKELLTGVSWQAIILLALVIVLQLVLTRTVMGRQLLAVGGNREAAVGAGIRADRYTLGAMTFSGACGGLAGVILSITVNTGSPLFGATMLVTVVAAVVIGGTSLYGGRGSAVGVLAGVLTISAMQVVLEFNDVPAYVQSVFLGVLLIVLVLADGFRRSRAARLVGV